uniref:Uncharacterized protein n=1 Tax=Leersia perrieri TaxID=77586 RepID=A0A0D9X3W5_9ORYZ
MSASPVSPQALGKHAAWTSPSCVLLSSILSGLIGFCVAYRLVDIFACFYINIGIDFSPSPSHPVYGRIDHPAQCTTTTHFSTMFVFKHIYHAIELWVTTVSPPWATASLPGVHIH